MEKSTTSQDEKQTQKEQNLKEEQNIKDLLEQFDALTMDKFLCYAFLVIANCDRMLINVLKTGKYPKLPNILGKMLMNNLAEEDLNDVPPFSPIYSYITNALQIDKILKLKGANELFYSNMAFPNYSDCSMTQYMNIKQRIASLLLMAQNNNLEQEKVDMCNAFLIDAFGFCYMPFEVFAHNLYGTLEDYQEDEPASEDEFDFPFNGFQA